MLRRVIRARGNCGKVGAVRGRCTRWAHRVIRLLGSPRQRRGDAEGSRRCWAPHRGDVAGARLERDGGRRRTPSPSSSQIRASCSWSACGSLCPTTPQIAIGDNLRKSRPEGTSSEPLRTAIELAKSDVDEATMARLLHRKHRLGMLPPKLADPRGLCRDRYQPVGGLARRRRTMDAMSRSQRATLKVVAAFGVHRQDRSHRPGAPTASSRASSKIVRLFVGRLADLGRRLNGDYPNVDRL